MNIKDKRAFWVDFASSTDIFVSTSGISTTRHSDSGFTTETRRKPTPRERSTKRRGAKKTTDPKRGQCGERGAHVAIGRSTGHRFNRFISMLNYAPRYFPSRDFRLP